MEKDCRGNEDEQQREERNERRRQRVYQSQRFQYIREVNNSQSKVDNEEHNCGNMTQTRN